MGEYRPGGHRIRRSAAAAALILVLAGCNGGSSSPSPSQVAPASAAAVVVSPSPSPGLRAPVAAPQTLTVLNGYDNPIAPANPTLGWCPPPGVNEHDHCDNQEDGLDLVPSDLADTRVLAPIGGTIAWVQADRNDPTTSCVGLRPTGSTLNLTVCHFETSAVYVVAGDFVATGTVLGQRKATDPWIHLSLDDRYAPVGGPQLPPPSTGFYPPVPFYDADWIEGHAFPSASPPVFNLYCGDTISSTNVPVGPHAALPPTPPSYAPAPPIDCATAVIASPTPPPTPRPTPQPTPKLTPKPTPPPLRPPAAPTDLMWTTTGVQGTDCAPGDPPGTECIPTVLSWASGGGVVTGYRLRDWAWLVTVGPPPNAKCGVGPLDTYAVPAAAKSYTLYSYGSPGPSCVEISAFNAAGSSPWVFFPPMTQIP